MRQRVIKNIQSTNFDKTKKTISFAQWNPLLPFVSCFAIIIIGFLLVSVLFNQQDLPSLEGTQEIYECSCVTVLAQAVGFAIRSE